MPEGPVTFEIIHFESHVGRHPIQFSAIRCGRETSNISLPFRLSWGEVGPDDLCRRILVSGVEGPAARSSAEVENALRRTQRSQVQLAYQETEKVVIEVHSIQFILSLSEYTIALERRKS